MIPEIYQCKIGLFVLINILINNVFFVSDVLLGLSRNFNLMFPTLGTLSPPAAPYMFNFPSSSSGKGIASATTTISAPEHECSRCGRKYNHSSSLKRHMTLECGKEPRFQCPYCPHRSKLKSNLYQHIRYRHQSQPSDIIFQPSDVPLNMSLPASTREGPGLPESK